MSTGISPASPLAALSTSPRPAAPMRTTGRAGAWVVALVWALPLLGFTAAALVAPSTGCDPALAGGVPCDARGSVVVLGVLSLVLLVPLGLLSLLLVPVLGALRWRPPAVVLALAATGSALAAGGVLILLGNLVA
jgi:hypothetical protein